MPYGLILENNNMAVVSRALLLIALVVLIVSLVVGTQRDHSLDQLQEHQIIRIGYAVEVPYAYVDDTGRVTGWSPELARQIAQQLDIARIEWIQVRFAELLPGLVEKRFDVVAAGLFITPQRVQQVAFSSPVQQVSSGLLVKAETELEPLSYADLVRHHKYTVAVLQNSVEHRRLQALGMPANRLLMIPDAYTGNIALKSGRADVLALSLPTLTAFFRIEPERLRLLPLLTNGNTQERDQVAFAFNLEAEQLLEAWNRVQAEVLAHLVDDLPDTVLEPLP